MSLMPKLADLVDARRAPLKDLLAGFTVAIVALPLALAFGVASGLGAEAGLTTAIIAGAIAAIFGGSRLQVSGPTGAMTVVLVPIFHDFGATGVLLVGLMAGALLAIVALAKVGEHVHRLPTSLVEGFTAGIAVVITLQQFPNILGVAPNKAEKVWQFAWVAISDALQNWSWQPVLVAASVATLILVGSHYWHKIPFALISVVCVTLLANWLQLDLTRIGSIPAEIGRFDFGFLNQAAWLQLIPSAIAVAALAALESLLSAKVADKMRGGGEKHDANRELFGQGLANLVVPFFGGVPATAALARTAVNVRANAQSKMAALYHAFILAVVVLLLAGLVGQIPLAALAGVLIATTAHMVKPRELLQTAKTSRLDAIVLLATLVATIFVDLITAVVLGLVLSLLLRKTRLSKLSRRYPMIDETETLGD